MNLLLIILKPLELSSFSVYKSKSFRVCLQVLRSSTACVKKVFNSLSWLQRKLHVIWKIASSDVTQWLSCIVGNDCTSFWKAVHRAIFKLL